MRISDWSSDVCSSDLETPGARRPVAAVALAREIGDRLDRDPSRAPVDGQFRLVEAVETIARGDAVGGNDQIVEIPPAVVAARMDRRHELRAKAASAVVASKLELDVAVGTLRVVGEEEGGGGEKVVRTSRYWG